MSAKHPELTPGTPSRPSRAARFLSPPELKKLLTTTGSNPLTVDEAEELIMWVPRAANQPETTLDNAVAEP